MTKTTGNIVLLRIIEKTKNDNSNVCLLTICKNNVEEYQMKKIRFTENKFRKNVFN